HASQGTSMPKPKKRQSATNATHPPAKRDSPKNQMIRTGQCARWMGVDTSYIVDEIRNGFLIANNVGHFGHKFDYRIHFLNFVAYLRARGNRRIPIDVAELQ